MAVPFDLKGLKVTGPPVPILEAVTMASVTGAAEFGAFADGSLAYVPGAETGVERTLAWVDRKGTSQPLSAPPHPYGGPRLSPDGQRVAVGAVGIVGGNTGVWVYDLARGTLTRLIETGRTLLASPIWTPDGKRLTFQSGEGALMDLYWMSADGSGGPERLAHSDSIQWPGSWS